MILVVATKSNLFQSFLGEPTALGASVNRTSVPGVKKQKRVSRLSSISYDTRMGVACSGLTA